MSQIKGFVIRSKASYIEGGEKNTKYFASLEKKRSDAKTLHKLVINGTEYTSQREILEKTKSYYETMYTEQIIDEEKMKKMNENISVKLNDKEKLSIEGIVTEYECACALKQMNNNKSPGSDGLTTEFFKTILCIIFKLFFRNRKLNNFTKTRYNIITTKER